MIASTGMHFDLSTPHGHMLATMLASVAEFERDLLRERVRSGLDAARAPGVKLGRPFGTRVKSDPLTPDVLARLDRGASYRAIARELGTSKNTVVDTVARHRPRTSGSLISPAAGQLQPSGLCEIDAEAVAPALVAARPEAARPCHGRAASGRAARPLPPR